MTSIQEDLVHEYYSEPISNWACNTTLNIEDITSSLAQRIKTYLSNTLKCEVYELEELSESLPDSMLIQDLNYAVNKISNYMYDIIDEDPEFRTNYQKMVSCISRHLPFENPCVQAIPTLRAHFTKDTFSLHPTWHSDLFLGHPIRMINVWIPFTKPCPKQHHGFSLLPKDLCKKIVSSEFNDKQYYNWRDKKFIKDVNYLKDAEDVNILPGHALIFDSRVFHSSMPLTTQLRFSMDIRFIDKTEIFNKSIIFKGNGRNAMLFDLENFYREI